MTSGFPWQRTSNAESISTCCHHHAPYISPLQLRTNITCTAIHEKGIGICLWCIHPVLFHLPSLSVQSSIPSIGHEMVIMISLNNVSEDGLRFIGGNQVQHNTRLIHSAILSQLIYLSSKNWQFWNENGPCIMIYLNALAYWLCCVSISSTLFHYCKNEILSDHILYITSSSNIFVYPVSHPVIVFGFGAIRYLLEPILTQICVDIWHH